MEGESVLTGEDYNVTSDSTINGNILSLVDKAWDALRPHLVQTKFDKAARFEQRSIYPELACREALLNSIAHRDYSDEGRATEVYVFSDHLEVRNPGSLLSSIRIEDIVSQKGVHQSRNTHIARVLRELGYMRELGEGMRRIYDLMHKNELAPPKLESRFDSFSITLTHQAMYSQKDLLWLAQFDGLPLDREQKAIILLGQNQRVFAASEIWDAVGIVDTEHYRKLVDSLMRMGILKNRVERNEAKRLAARKKTPFKNFPRYGIDLPNSQPELKAPAISNSRGNAPTGDLFEEPPSQDGSKLFIGNLPYQVEREALMDIFTPFGEVLELSLPKQYGRSKGFGFVEFSTYEAAQKVLENPDGIAFDDRKLVIRPALPKQKK